MKLVIQNITKKYQRKVLNNFSYVFENNNIYCLIGKSGIGKSTLLNIIGGLNKKYDGDVYFDNINIKRLKNYTFNDVGYLSQKYQLFDKLSVIDNIMLPLKMKDKESSKYLLKAKLYLELFKLSDKINEKVINLSGGQKQRIAFIREMIKEPKIMLLDEPTSALDYESTDILFNILKENKKKMIIIMVTHNNNLANRCDVVIDMSSIKSIKEPVIERKNYHEEPINFHNINKLRKNIFNGSKLLNYICSSITTLGLVCIFLSMLLKSFVGSVIQSNFEYLTFNNCVTYKEIDNDTIIDFKNEKLDYNYTYYEGIEHEQKEKLKALKMIDYVDFNDYDIENVDFIYDNYLTTYNDNIILEIPSYAKEYINRTNFLNVYLYDGKSFKIPVDKIIISEDNNFLIYCNNVNYLRNILFKVGYDLEVSSYYYSNQVNKLYDYLISNDRYKNYYFIKQFEMNLIYIGKLPFARISNNNRQQLLNNNEIDYYIESDFVHNYIDYNTGFSYINIDGSTVQVKIDNYLNNKIQVTSLYYRNHQSKNLTIDGKIYEIDKIIDNENIALIFMDANTFNSFNDEITYVGMAFSSNNINTNFQINKYLFKVDSFTSINYIVRFLSLFGIIIFILAMISSIVIFRINFIKKQKDTILLINLGVYEKIIYRILLYDPISNVILSVFSSIIGLVFSKFLIEFIYINMFHMEINIAINIFTFIGIIIAPIALISILSILMVYRFYYKYGLK